MDTFHRLPIPHQQLAAFAERWRVRSLSLFGSALRGDFRPDSDVDLLVEFHDDARPSLFDLFRMEDELAGMFGRRVDLTTRQSVQESPNWIRRRETLNTARTIYDAA
ncbi:MAG: nucleotidyltransferase family protein [Phycisphaeraceae bacterium]